MSADRSHPPHTRTRLSQAGLVATGAGTTALGIGIVSGAPAPPPVPPSNHPAPSTQGIADNVARVAGAAEGQVSGHPVGGLEVYRQMHQQQLNEQHFYNTYTWNA